MTEQEKNEAIQALNGKNAKLPCPRCGGNQFTLLDGYLPASVHPSQNSLGNVIVGGPIIPCIAVACANCGFLALHAMVPLGLLKKRERSSSEKSENQPSVPGGPNA